MLRYHKLKDEVKFYFTFNYSTAVLPGCDVVRLSTNVLVKEVIGKRIQANNAGRIKRVERESRYGDKGNLFVKDILSFL